MLLCWQKAELQDTALSDSNYDEEEEYDDNSELAVGYTTYNEYELYAPQLVDLWLLLH